MATAWIAQTPALVPYRFPILDAYRQQAHVLDDKGERLLSLASQFNGAPVTMYEELSTADIKFPTLRLADGKDVVLSPGNYASLLEGNRDQAERGRAAAAYLGTYGATANTYAAMYNGILQRDWFMARARNFDTTLDAALDGNAIPRAVVETLVDATRSGTAPFQRYARLRQKLLGLASYHPYDSFMPIYQSTKRYPFEEARDLALASVAPLGDEYVTKYKRFVSGGRIDVYENEGKRSGAYSAGVYGVGPYMLMNYNDTLDAAFTLAHEAGHSMHTVLSYETQPFVTANYTIFVAEVASTTNERLLLDKLLQQTSDPKERFLLLQHAVDSIVGTFYTQVIFADFELRAHRLVEKGEPVTTEVLNTLYAGLLKEYWGDALTVDDFYKFTWSRIGHFFFAPYYVYQYATCFASSAQLYDAMTTGMPEARKAATDRYLTLLRSGGNDHPMAQLKKAGVDLTQRATIQAVIDQMDRLVTQMEKEAAKIS
jgi:oligoendopeptidase F